MSAWHLLVALCLALCATASPVIAQNEVLTHVQTQAEASESSLIFPYTKGLPAKTLLVAVMTAPAHIRARTALREAWQHYYSSDIVSRQDMAGCSLKFFVGFVDQNNTNSTQLEQSLQSEQQTSNDLVRLNMTESYFNLTRKTLGIVEFAKQEGYSNVFKMDDDTFLRLDNLVQFLKSEMRPGFIYGGSFVSDNPVIDNPNSKWYNRDLYDHDIYPQYASGPGYFLGSRVLDHIYNKRESLILYRVEDAAVGIWTEDMMQIDRVNLNVLAYSMNCEDSLDVIYVNPVNSTEMSILMGNVLKGNMCANNFLVSECQKRPCLCHPAPEECEYLSNVETWSDFSNDKYQDLIPRLIQKDARSFAPSKN